MVVSQDVQIPLYRDSYDLRARGGKLICKVSRDRAKEGIASGVLELWDGPSGVYLRAVQPEVWLTEPDGNRIHISREFAALLISKGHADQVSSAGHVSLKRGLHDEYARQLSDMSNSGSDADDGDSKKVATEFWNEFYAAGGFK